MAQKYGNYSFRVSEIDDQAYCEDDWVKCANIAQMIWDYFL
jgi:hypothetical protein